LTELVVDDDAELAVVLLDVVAAKTQGEAIIAAIVATAAMVVSCAVLVFNFRQPF